MRRVAVHGNCNVFSRNVYSPCNVYKGQASNVYRRVQLTTASLKHSKGTLRGFWSKAAGRRIQVEIALTSCRRRQALIAPGMPAWIGRPRS